MLEPIPTNAPSPAAPADAPSPAVLFLAKAGALLLLLGLLTGGLVAAAETGQVSADPHTTIASHLNAILGGLWLFAVAWTLPMLRYGAVGQKRLAWGFIVFNYANWIVTAVKSFFHVAGVTHTGNTANDAVFGTLTVLVVIPALISTGAWLYGFRRA